MTQPTSVTADGRLKVLWVPSIADTSAPTVAELTAGTVVELTCYLTATGYTPGADEQAVTDDRLCSRQTFQRRGRISRTLEVTYVYNPTSPGDDEAYQALTPGTLGHIVTRWAVDYENAIAAADIVDVWPVEAGEQRKMPPEANSVLMTTQSMFVRGEAQMDVAVAA